MVVRSSLHLRVLALAMLIAPAALTFGQFVPSTIPCSPVVRFKLLPGRTYTDPVKVTVNGTVRNVVPGLDGADTVIEVHLATETECNQTVQIDFDTNHETYQIAPKPVADNPVTQVLASGAPASSSEAALYTAIIASVAAFLALIFSVLIWLKQRKMMQMAELSAKDIHDVLNQMPDPSTRDPSQKYTDKLLKPILEGIQSVKSAGKDPGLSEVKFSQLTGQLGTVDRKVDAIMTGLANLRKEQVASNSEYAGPDGTSTQARSQYLEAPSAASLSKPSLTPFEDAYNRANAGTEHRLPGVDRVISVTPRGGGDKNPNAKEPLIEDPTGQLRVFFVSGSDPYLAPSRETMAQGIGGTHKRAWGHLFDFEGKEEATSLLKAATVKRFGDEYEIEEKGTMT